MRRCELVDRYIRGTHLRLRRVTTDDTVVVKLAQKIRVSDADPERVMLTNLYLSADEHETLAALPADVIAKTRWAATWAGTGLAVDEFHGQLSGLVLAETELGPDDQLLGLPAFADETSPTTTASRAGRSQRSTPPNSPSCSRRPPRTNPTWAASRRNTGRSPLRPWRFVSEGGLEPPRP